MAVNYNDGKWWGWNGGECPVHPETIGDITYFDGMTYKDCKMGQYDWDAPLLFRVIKEHREPREGWVYASDIRYDKPDDYEMQVFVHVREVIE